MSRADLCRFFFCICVLLHASEPAFPQSRLNLVDVASTVSSLPVEEDTATAVVAATLVSPDTLRTRYHARLDAGYHTKRVHPYFRDEYRIIQDVRRLVLFVDPFVLIGLESIPELYAIVERLPQHKQTEMIRVALAGSLVNQISEMVSRELRRSKLKFVQWQLEKVVLSKAFPQFYLHAYDGVNAQGISLHVPKLKLTYSNQSTKYYAHEGFHFAPHKHLGFAYGWSGGRPAYGPRFSTPWGSGGFTYDERHEVLLASYEFRRSMSAIIRMVYVNYLKVPNLALWRSEVMLRW